MTDTGQATQQIRCPILVHVKAPPTEIRIEGVGAEAVLATLREAYPDLAVEPEDSDDEETLPVRDTDWYRSMRDRMTAGMALRLYRENAGLSLRQLAEKSGVAFSNLSAYENDRRKMGAATAKKVADVLLCRLEPLLGRFD